MTDLQDRILDRLVGTRVGVNWPGGPLVIAAEVVGGREALSALRSAEPPRRG